MTDEVDFFVIGAGSGGVRAARIAAGHGARVMIAESDRVGGTCVIRGCVPKKFSVYASAFSDSFHLARDYGWNFGDTRFDWATFKMKRDQEIARLEEIYVRNLERAGVELVRERARLAGENSVYLETNKRVVKARHVLIATGGRPALPSIPGIDLASTSDDFFLMETLPSKAIVVGGGYIAVEFASILNGLGVDTHLVYRGDLILRGFDRDLRLYVQQAMQARGITFHLGVFPQALERDGTTLTYKGQKNETFTADRIFFCTGRDAQTDNLGLETLGLACAKGGLIKVDQDSTTPHPWLHAVGDITGRATLTPVAIREGHALADRLFGGLPPRRLDYQTIPTAVFSQPEMGTVGMSEEEALKAGKDIKIYRSAFREMKLSFSEKSEKTLLKMIVDKTNDRILGLHMVGSGAGELIQGLAISVVMGATKADFDRTVAVHPTAAEEWVTMTNEVAIHQPDTVTKDKS